LAATKAGIAALKRAPFIAVDCYVDSGAAKNLKKMTGT
jgi:hypothetical protein